MKKLLLPLLICLMCLCALPAGAEVIINEIMTNNGVFTDGERYDWIELYNSGSKAVNLSGYGLSDSKKKPMQWTFPQDTVIQGNSYLLVYCTGVEGLQHYPRRSTYYAPFKLSDEGENIVLSDAKGNQLDLLKYPQQYGNTSYGRNASGKWGYFDDATPKAANAKTNYAGQSAKPVIETKAGFYTLSKGESLEVTISGKGEIRYTLDGSEPTRSSKLYSGPIKINKTTVLRAVACQQDLTVSPSVGATYLINDPAPVAVACLSTDVKYLRDQKIGIFVVGNNKQSNYMYDWEYPAFFEYFDENGERQLGQNVSFRITGTSTRGYQQKSVAVYARDAYGDENRFYYNPFENRDYDSYKAFILRSTGSDHQGARMKDVVMTSLAKGLDIMYQDATPIIVYVNGEYYGQYNLREKVNKHSVAQWEGVTDSEIVDQIDVLEGSADDNHIQNGDNEEWLALREFVKTHDLNVPENLAYVTDRLDVDNFFTWVSLQLGYHNDDLENVRVYRVPGGKWKYILYDVEAGGKTDPRGIYMLLDANQAGSRISSHYSLVNNLLKVPEMRERFLTIFAYVMEHSFLYESVVDPVIDEWVETLEVLLPRHVKRYTKLTMGSWRSNVNAFRYGMRLAPKKSIDEVCKILKVTSAEKEKYFGHVLELLTVQNAKEKQ